MSTYSTPTNNTFWTKQRVFLGVVTLCWILAIIALAMAHSALNKRIQALPEITFDVDSGTFETTNWSRYEANLPPRRKNNDSTSVKISLSRLTPILTMGDELHLNLLLVQEWTDERLIINSEKKVQENLVTNINLIKNRQDKFEIWKPSLATDPMSSGACSSFKDETWLWGNGTRRKLGGPKHCEIGEGMGS